MEMITVEAIIEAPIEVVWNLWTNPEHLKQWNFASPDWHCPKELNIQFETEGNATKIIETFEPEEVNSLELQKQGWLAILNQFKLYVEGK